MTYKKLSSFQCQRLRDSVILTLFFMEDSIEFIEKRCDGVTFYASTSMFLGHIAVIAGMACVNMLVSTYFKSYLKYVVHN